MITGDNDLSVRELVQQIADQRGITYDDALHLLIEATEMEDKRNAG